MANGFLVSPLGLDFHHHADLDDLLRKNVKEGTRVLGVTAEEDE